MTDVTAAVSADSVPFAPSGSVLDTLFRSEQGGHEQVLLCQDRASGLKAVIAIHSTALGPALGGTRFHASGQPGRGCLAPWRRGASP